MGTIHRAPNHCEWRRMTVGVPKVPTMSQVLSSINAFASERPKVQTWGCQTCFSPRAPSNLVTTLNVILFSKQATKRISAVILICRMISGFSVKGQSPTDLPCLSSAFCDIAKNMWTKQDEDRIHCVKKMAVFKFGWRHEAKHFLNAVKRAWKEVFAYQPNMNATQYTQTPFACPKEREKICPTLALIKMFTNFLQSF